MVAVKYLLDLVPESSIEKRRDNCRPYGLGQDGYGRKIACPYLLKFNSRWHRVYCVCFSNSGSHYVLVKGQAYYLGAYDPS